MPDLVRLSYYPFLPEVREAVRSSGPPLSSVLTSPVYESLRQRAVERVEGSLGEGFGRIAIVEERDALQELLSVAVARMLCVLLGDKTLCNRYATAEARRVGDAMANDREPAMVATAAQALGITAAWEGTDEDMQTGAVADPSAAKWSVHFSTYILNAPLHEPAWKLVHRALAAGRVTLTQAELGRLCQEALAKRIAGELDTERTRPLPEEVKQALQPYAEQLLPRLEQARESWSTGDFGPVQPGLFPPCIKELFEGMRRGENIPHHGRFAFATFLGTIGWNSEQIMDYMATLPNFDREKSRYQIEHVTGQRGVDKYTPPGCGTMQTNGVCPLDKRDGLCMKIKHPLSYYRAKLRFQKLDEERAKNAAPVPVAPPAGGQA